MKSKKEVIKEDKFLKLLIIALVPLTFLFIVIDDFILSKILSLRNNTLDMILIFLSQVFTKGIIFLFVFLLLFKKRKYEWSWIFSFFLSLLVSKVLKVIIARPRPFELFPFIHNLIPAGNFSFPSGHATLMFAALPFLFLTYPKQKWLFFVIALILALSRVYFGVHYISDIFAGMFVGLISSMVVLLIRNKTYQNN